MSESLDAIAERLQIVGPDASTRLAGARAGLFKARDARVHPGRDEKILTSWNALAIAGLARAGNALGMARWIDLACDATDALHRTAWRDGRLLATRRGERADLNAYLDDHAFLLAALIDLMQARFRRSDYDWACEIADVLIARFGDTDRGGFFFTSHDHEKLFHRTKPGHDNATPSGNGIAAQSLALLGHLASEPRYLAAAQRTVDLFAADVSRTPAGHCTLLEAAGLLEVPPALVVLAGDPEVCAQWHRALASGYRPATLAIDVSGVPDVPAPLAKGAVPKSGAVAYVCHGATCLPPVSSLDELLAAIA